MTDKDKTTDASKVELDDSDLDQAQGAGIDAYLKLDGLDGESKDAHFTETITLNFGKIENTYDRQTPKDTAQKLGSKTLKR